MGERACDQCTAITKKGTRCKLTTCVIGPKCWIHTLAEDKLKVKKSHIKEAGKGLYAQKGRSKKDKSTVFKKGSTIAEYTGEILTRDQVNRMPVNQRAYILQHNNNRYIDAVKTNSGPARYANDCRASNKAKGECTGNNSKFTQSRHKMNLKATKNIKNTDEIFVSYGSSYWSKERSKVNKKKVKAKAKAKAVKWKK